MYLVLAVLLLALAGFTMLVVRRPGAEVSEEVAGFAYVGAAGITLLTVAVVVVGLVSGVPGRAEGLALLGFGAYVVYLFAAWVMITVVRRRP